MPKSSTSNIPRVAVIGAGIAGLACARALQDAGACPVVLEKSRGLGGRLATRRTDDGWRFDHGAQYMTARGHDFRTLMATSAAEGTAHIWNPAAAQDAAIATGEDWFVGAPSMNAFLKSHAGALDLRVNTRVTDIRRDAGAWVLMTEPAQSPDRRGNERFDIVVCATPAPQAQALARRAAPDLAAALAGVRMSPCRAAMVGFQSRYDPGFDVWRSAEGGLAWVCRNASKPGRDSYKDGWIIHASPDWSARHLEDENDAALEAVLAMFRARFTGLTPEIVYAKAHRWRYALTTAPLGRAYAADATQSFFAIGDWCLGARVECAFDSGVALGVELAKRFAAK